MERLELLEIIARGEDSKHQFKLNVTSEASLAKEFVALSNSGGGQIFIGVGDDGEPAGLLEEDVLRLNQLISNAASQHIKPPIAPTTENIRVSEGRVVMAVRVRPGISMPYMDNDGAIWLKCGSDKRKAISREEIQRIFQNSGIIHGDEVPVAGMNIGDLDIDYFKKFFKKTYGRAVEDQDLSLPQLVRNLNLSTGDSLNVAGALLFGRDTSFKLPMFIAKAASWPTGDVAGSEYIDGEDIDGKIEDVFHKSMGFIVRNLLRVQGAGSVNAPGQLEIPREALEEIVANALIHRDYFIMAPVRVFVFPDRLEIISPGHLPNNLTIENIKSGNSNIRNPILASFATKILPYRGLGSGILRALRLWPDIEFIDDRENTLFKVIIKRKV